MTRIAVFCTPEQGHFQLLRPIISGLSQRSADLHVFTSRLFQPMIEADGATFVDLYGRYPLELADDTSRPYSSRHVTYAGCFAERVAEDLELLQPSLIICETFALVGCIAAGLVGLPWVNVSPGHNLDPTRFLSGLAVDPRVNTAPSCHRAVATLRNRLGLPEASPFSFVTSVSRWLNIYCEPPEFLNPDERCVFEPLAFFGSLSTNVSREKSTGEFLSSSSSPRRRRVYISFGTVVWRSYRNEATSALRALAAYLAKRPDMEALISLGRATIDGDLREELTSANVRVESYVDQCRVLSETDVFVTHHGINSTHESIAHCVPMLSYPFYWDQPSLAAKCQELGLAIPLGTTLRGTLDDTTIHDAFQRLACEADWRTARLRQAREQELDVMEGRDDVFQRMLALTAPDRTPALTPE